MEDINSPATGPQSSLKSISHSFPALRGLGLDEPQLVALRRQGYLDENHRTGAKSPYWRLRFRQAGRWQTIYLGADGQRVSAVRQELAELRCAEDRRRQLVAVVEQGRRTLRKIKLRLGPALAARGLYYHGDTIRQRRARPPQVS